MKKIKKIIIAIVISAFVLCGAVFGFFLLKKNAQSKKTVNVFPIADVGMNGGFDYNNETMSGYVTTDKEQNIYLSSSDKISEVYVQEGDVVHAGDVILEYDTTVQSLKLQSMRADAEVARTDILAAERQLKKLQETVPIEDMPEPTTEEPTTEEPTTEAPTTEAPTTEAPTTEAPTTEAPTTEAPTTEAPTTEAPTSETPTTEEPTTEEPTTEQPTTETPKPEDETDEQPGTPKEEEPDDFEGPEDFENLYTREELNQAIEAKKREIQSLKINYQIKLLDLEIEQNKSANGQVICSFDGVVKTVEDQDTAIMENKPYITISGSEGYAVRSSIGELSLGNYHIGDTVSMTCYDNGMYYTGTISEISTTPAEDGYYSSKVQSFYDVIILIDSADELRQGMYMEISFDSSNNMEEGSDDYYIPLAFVQKENGKYFVYKDVDGVLKKEYVKTGDILWGDMIAIKSGVSMDDYLALPSAKNAKDGVKTEKKDINALYGY